MLVLDRVTYRYPGSGRWALPPTSLEVRAGQVVGVRGPNESGKTTLCLVASGLAPVAIGGELKGRALIDGRSTLELRTHELAQRCGLLFDNPSAQLTGLHRTVAEEVAFGPCNLGLPPGTVVERTEAALRLLGIEHLAHRDPARLSGGETQLVALAGLVALRPPYLALDEPVSRLDPERSAQVATAIERLAAAGVGVLVTEHDEELLARVCDLVLDLGGGG
ncbi:MAG TPA: ABC transporter ATP-binding protein [Candidatus Dormibacteraeota bacterium]|nr:ABC transporter ATP-binding protein [Candidatus Dormibacteraeota bacterium]